MELKVSAMSFILVIMSIQLSFGSFIIEATTSKRIVCYYTYPSDFSALKPNNIDSNLCTHILIGFATIQNNSIVVSTQEEQVIKQVVELKKQNSRLKVLLSIGGGGGTFGFPEMVQNKSSRSEFISSADKIMNQLNLDGIDLDWEFPSDILKNQKGLLINLLEDIRNKFDNSTKQYLLSIAVAAPITLVAVSYDIPEINKLVDFVNIMSYDYNFFSLLTPWTQMNAPLYARSSDHFYFATQNIDYTSRYWLRRGMSKEKMNVGLPVYAHTYTLASPNRTYVGAPAISNGKLGSDGSATYGDVCDFMKKLNLTPVFDDESKSPYVTNGEEWISYENDMSMKFKADYVSKNDFGGVMVFSLSSDDYDGHCQPGITFPNTRMINKIFTQ